MTVNKVAAAGDVKSGSLIGGEPAPNAVCVVGILVAMVGAIMFGIDQGNFGQVQGFHDFIEDWCVKVYKGSLADCENSDSAIAEKFLNNFVRWGNSWITLGAAAGALLLGPPIASKFGRRMCIFSGACITFVACLFASYLSFANINLFMVARFFTGFGIGICTFVLPIYNAELATASIRGRTGGLFQFFVVIGVALAVVITTFYQDWKFGVFLPGIAGILVAIAVWFLPESPRWLMQNKSYDAGLSELRRIRVDPNLVEQEATEMWHSIEEEKSAGQISWGDMITNKSVLKRVCIANLIMIFQQFTGINFFIAYANTVYKLIGFDKPFLANMIGQIFFVTGIITGIYLIDYEGKLGGRRATFFMSSAFCGLSMVVAAVAKAADLPGIIIICAVCVYNFGFQIAWGPGAWVYVSEIFTMRERDRANGLAVGLEYGANFVIVVITPLMTEWSVVGSFAVFAALNLSYLGFTWMFMPETKGVPLEDVPALFESNR